MINIKNLATCFGSKEPSSYENTVLVHSHFHIWPDYGSFEPKHVAKFLILITIYIYYYVVYWNKLLYYCNTQRDGHCQRFSYLYICYFFILNYENLSGFFPWDLPVVKISPAWVTGPQQGKSSGRIATFSLWTPHLADGIIVDFWRNFWIREPGRVNKWPNPMKDTRWWWWWWWWWWWYSELRPFLKLGFMPTF